jgi:hypothetical protein
MIMECRKVISLREKKMNNQGSFLNVRDFGAKASRYTSVVHSAKGSDSYEIDGIAERSIPAYV